MKILFFLSRKRTQQRTRKVSHYLHLKKYRKNIRGVLTLSGIGFATRFLFLVHYVRASHTVGGQDPCVLVRSDATDVETPCHGTGMLTPGAAETCQHVIPSVVASTLIVGENKI